MVTFFPKIASVLSMTNASHSREGRESDKKYFDKGHCQGNRCDEEDSATIIKIRCKSLPRHGTRSGSNFFTTIDPIFTSAIAYEIDCKIPSGESYDRFLLGENDNPSSSSGDQSLGARSKDSNQQSGRRGTEKRFGSRSGNLTD